MRRIITDGIEVMDGTLQLRQITAKKDQLIYEIIFIGKMANIFNELGDAELNGLDDNGQPLIDFSATLIMNIIMAKSQAVGPTQMAMSILCLIMV